jgi:hypothetical protein
MSKFIGIIVLAWALAPMAAAQNASGPVEAKDVRSNCQVTQFEMQPGQKDDAVVLKDPAGEQTVLFDTVEGGAIVSLKYQGAEHIWGWNGGGLLQMAFHNEMKNGPWTGDYNPTQAGDGTSMSPVTGIFCQGTDSLTLMTMMLDFNNNNGGYPRALLAIWGGRVNESIPGAYFSPYTLETHAHWVPNPAGEPRYYLQLDERFTHIADEMIGKFGYDFADYMPWDFMVRAISPENCPCDQAATNYLAGGWYRDATRTSGLAVAMPSSNFPGLKVSGVFNSDFGWRNHNFHLGAEDSLDGIQSKTLVWYVLPGSWENALKFARQFPH